MYEARKRFGFSVLNYQVTSNHVRLLVRDRGTGEIERSMQLIASCTGQAYNRRKRRRGSFWEDCYHATVVDTDEYLARCFVYIDLNMVRARVVHDPREWRESGYHEIQRLPERYRIVDRAALCELVGVADERLAVVQNEWIESSLGRGEHLEPVRSPDGAKPWRSVVGAFVEEVQEKLGARARYRRVDDGDGLSILRDGEHPYCPRFGGEIAALSGKSAVDFAES